MIRKGMNINSDVRAALPKIDALFDKMIQEMKKLQPDLPPAFLGRRRLVDAKLHDPQPGLHSYALNWGVFVARAGQKPNTWTKVVPGVSFVYQTINGFATPTIVPILKPNNGTERLEATIKGERCYTIPAESVVGKSGEEQFDFVPEAYEGEKRLSLAVQTKDGKSLFVRRSLAEYLELMQSLCDLNFKVTMSQTVGDDESAVKLREAIKKEYDERTALLIEIRNGSSEAVLAAPVHLWHPRVELNQMSNHDDFIEELNHPGPGYSVVTFRKFPVSKSDPTAPIYSCTSWNWNTNIPLTVKMNQLMHEKYDFKAFAKLLFNK